jgi:hypothetical protein
MEKYNLQKNIDLNTIIEINKIIERDTLESSYKLALLKSIILVIKKFDHHIQKSEDYVKIPFYFVVEEWFFYYLPFEYLKINQHKTTNNKDLVLNKNIDLLYQEIFEEFSSLCKKNDWKCIYVNIYKKYFNFELNTIILFRELRKLIFNNPMKYMGEEKYQFFKDIEKPKRNFDRQSFQNFGYFKMEIKFYKVLKYLGDNFYGLNTIIFRWEKLLNGINKEQKQENFDFKDILTHNIDLVIRDTSEIQKNFRNKEIYCVWSGKKIKKFDVDHLLPFSVFMNNDYWNLLPSSPKINSEKRDKIPSIELIESSKDRILYYWDIYKKEFKNFELQRKISLGIFYDENQYIEELEKKSEFLIDKLGYREFKIEN